jgi:HlyD family secretion protein
MNSIIIDHTQANDTLVIALGKPAQALRLTYYTLLLLLVAALVWASLSVVDIAVHASGVIRPPQGTQTLHSATTGYLKELRVCEQQSVQAGDTLAVLDGAALSQRLRLQRAKHERLLQEIADMRNVQMLNANARYAFPVYATEVAVKLKEREALQQELRTLRTKEQRVQELFAKQFISAEEYEQSRFQREHKELALTQWQETTARAAAERLQQMTLQAVELESEVKSLSIEQRNVVLCAPTSGVVSVLHHKTPNVLINAGTPVATILPHQEPVAEFFIAANDVGFVKQGLAVQYQVEAFPFQEWGMLRGTVKSVANDVTLNGQTAQFLVRGGFDSRQLHSPRHQARVTATSGMTVRAHVVVAQKRLITMLWDKTVAFFAVSS